jgi:hypothetical protein
MNMGDSAQSALAADAALEFWSDRLRETEAAHGFDQGHKLLYCPRQTPEGSARDGPSG